MGVNGIVAKRHGSVSPLSRKAFKVVPIQEGDGGWGPYRRLVIVPVPISWGPYRRLVLVPVPISAAHCMCALPCVCEFGAYVTNGASVHDVHSAIISEEHLFHYSSLAAVRLTNHVRVSERRFRSSNCGSRTGRQASQKEK